jgi:hypothetical protein
MQRADQILEQNHVQHISAAPQRLPDWNKSAGGIEAYYFKDPDGHPLEILHFPPDKGDPKWQKPNGRLFLGIDHTAIAVHDTLALPKTGLLPNLTGDLYLADIGIPGETYKRMKLDYLSPFESRYRILREQRLQ